MNISRKRFTFMTISFFIYFRKSDLVISEPQRSSTFLDASSDCDAYLIDYFVGPSVRPLIRNKRTFSWIPVILIVGFKPKLVWGLTSIRAKIWYKVFTFWHFRFPMAILEKKNTFFRYAISDRSKERRFLIINLKPSI